MLSIHKRLDHGPLTGLSAEGRHRRTVLLSYINQMLSVDKVSDTYFPAKPQEQKRRILVLDDYVDILNLVQDAFRHYGFEIDAYPNPDVALNAFVESPVPYDLILLDLKLDGMDGRRVYKKFKEQNPNSKICVFTGLNLDIDEFKRICQAFDEKYVIQKPVKFNG
jgi:CheY-like chemotaxis protein